MLDLLRKVVGMVLTVSAILAIIAAVIGGSATFAPITQAFDGGFDWKEFGAGVNTVFASSLGIPLLMLMVGLIGWSFDDAK